MFKLTRSVALFRFAVGCLMIFAGMLKAQPDPQLDAFIEFIEAARQGDVQTVKRLLAAGMDVNHQDYDGITALNHALHAHQFATARTLIEAGADLKNKAAGDYALTWAAQAGDADIIRLMLARGADPKLCWQNNQTGAHGDFPMDAALEWGRLDAVKELEKAGVSWLGNDRGANALRLVAKSHNVACAAYLISRGADVNGLCDGNTIWDGLILSGDIDFMELLISAGIRVNAVSHGQPKMNGWGDYARTPLVMAVLDSQLDVVRLLLQNGADPKALDNLAIKWADLLGDYEAFDLLRKAGAPDPGSFSYREWLHLDSVAGLDSLEVVRKNKTVAAPRFGRLNPGANLQTAALDRETKFAVISLGQDLDDVESLLDAKLSALDKAVVLERSQSRAILKERSLAQNAGRSRFENARLGRLLGADALVFLNSYSIEGLRVGEIRIVSVSTGLVTSVVPFGLDGEVRLDEICTRLANRCAADGTRIFTPMKEVRLVAVSPFTASVNTLQARELERQLGLLVAMRLSQFPGIFLVEREMLDQLQLENSAEDRVLLNSSWLVSGSVDPSLNDGGVALKLSLNPGLGGTERTIQSTGEAVAPDHLAETVVAEAAGLLNATQSQRWSPRDEAGAFFRQSEEFFKRTMWAEAERAAQASAALGLRNDDQVRRLQLQSAANRILFSGVYYTAAKRKKHELWGVNELMSYRVPLLLPPEDERELTVDEYFEEANIILDLLDPILARTDKKIGGLSYESWVCGTAWEAASRVLKITEALSYQKDYGEARAALQTRVLALNTRALQIARERNEPRLIHTLIAIRCKHMAWWVNGDQSFQDEVLGLLREAKGWAPPRSEHAVWGAAHEIGLAHMALISGRAAQSWVRLARVMAKSQDVRERYFGVALLDHEIRSKVGNEQTIAQLMHDFPSLVELDRSIPARVNAIGYKMEYTASEGGPFECWYTTVFDHALNLRMKLNYLFGTRNNTWSPDRKERRLLPELRQFYFSQCSRRLELIIEKGPSGYFFPIPDDEPMGANQGARLSDLTDQAKSIFAAFLKTYPEMADDVSALMRKYPGKNTVARLGKKNEEVITDRLVLKNPRLAFEHELNLLSIENKKRTEVFLGSGRNSGDYVTNVAGKQWWIGRMDGDSLVYDFNSAGETITLIGPGNVDGFHYVSDASVVGRSDLNDRYFASAGYRYEGNYEKGAKCLLVYDRIAGSWRALFPKQAFKYIYSINIFGEKLVYSFVYNPIVEAAGTSQDTLNYERDGDPLSGVMQYDMKSDRYDLLVSNRRNPSQSPIDGPARRYRELVRISDHEFLVEGGETHVFDISTDTWRTRTSADKTNAIVRNVPWEDFELNGVKWSFRYDPFGATLICVRKEPSATRLKIPLVFDDGGFIERLAPYARIAKSYRVAQGNIPRQSLLNSGGIAFAWNDYYYWLPFDQLNSFITKASHSSPAAAP